MISLDQINSTILELESARDTTFAACAKLADLYIVRNNLINGEPEAKAQPLETVGASEFMQTVNGKNSSEVWRIIDELMEALKIANPKLYSSVINRILKID